MVGSTDACYISIPYCSACSNLRYSNSHLAACLCAWKAAEDDPSTWDPAIPMGNPNGVPGFWLQPGPDLAVWTFLGSTSR